jgi:hypothetical protein
MRLHRCFLTVLACLALAAPAAASARPVEQFLDDPATCDSVCEQQVLASRGTGAPTEPAVVTSDAPSLPSPDSGLDTISIVLGAAGAAAVMALVAPALSRRRLRTARP